MDETLVSVSDLQESLCEELLVAQAAEIEPTNLTEIELVKELQQSKMTQWHVAMVGDQQKYWRPETQLF